MFGGVGMKGRDELKEDGCSPVMVLTGFPERRA
jgi:hypothetical protein